MAVAYLAAAYAALCLSLACTERREVIVEEEAHVAPVKHIVNELLVKLGAEGDGCQRLCLATGEDGASVRNRQRRDLTPDRTYVCRLAAVETDALVEDAAAHGVTLNIVVVLVCQSVLLLKLILGEVCVSCGISLLELCDDSLESLCARMLLKGHLRYVVCLLVKLVLDLLAEILVIDLVAVLALHIRAKLLHELCLERALRLDCLVGCLEGVQEVLLLHFLHLTLHHHDVLSRSSDHKVHVSLGHLGEGRIDDELSIHACYTHFGYRALERDV